MVRCPQHLALPAVWGRNPEGYKDSVDAHSSEPQPSLGDIRECCRRLVLLSRR
jgi:hypothetical protein